MLLHFLFAIFLLNGEPISYEVLSKDNRPLAMTLSNCQEVAKRDFIKKRYSEENLNTEGLDGELTVSIKCVTNQEAMQIHNQVQKYINKKQEAPKEKIQFQARNTPVCYKKDKMIEILTKRYREYNVLTGVGNRSVFEIFLSKDNTTWTIVRTNTNNISCIVAAGQVWIPKTPEEPDISEDS